MKDLRSSKVIAIVACVLAFTSFVVLISTVAPDAVWMLGLIAFAWMVSDFFK